MANVLRDLSPKCHGGMITGQRRDDERTGQDPQAARELFLNKIMSEVNLEGEASQVRKQEREKGVPGRKNNIKQRTQNMKQQDTQGKLRS